ncbi:hypothetical protein CMO89_03165 [Candidatus Woesearchaeota archaeon]|nr:hypothetical protein [Candidatus Woesearchaeota archaeon]|tara:strand:+ start:2076 stop:2594 length:519 start_codon:yes stop_codon:yes gene_type:complete
MNEVSLVFQKYREYTDSFLKKGGFPVKDTSAGYWGISICEEVFELFKKLRLRHCNNFLDLGSGDGRVTAIASLFTNATGVEADKGLYETSLKIKDELKLNCNFINKDFYELDISKFDIIYCFPGSLDYKFERKLAKELKGKLILTGPYSLIKSMDKRKIIEVNGNMFVVYSR